MIQVEDHIIIHRPVEEVFAFVADLSNGPKWQDGLIEVRQLTGGPLRVGTQHTAVRKFLGRRLEVTTEFIRYEPNEIVTFTANSGSLRVQTSYVTEATAKGTRLTCRMQMEQGGLFSLTEPLIARSVRSGIATEFLVLKAMLEALPEPA
jgi:uncharacterized membrane protein